MSLTDRAEVVDITLKADLVRYFAIERASDNPHSGQVVDTLVSGLEKTRQTRDRT